MMYCSDYSIILDQNREVESNFTPLAEAHSLYPIKKDQEIHAETCGLDDFFLMMNLVLVHKLNVSLFTYFVLWMYSNSLD